ncbi:hypothetical protein [Psychromonas antarctica]|uniref:hypothetical protein n=1 Tax=Psychromonas antarctica TaxID=67573 RepID=UPI001EE7B9FE|nr:hypothetical protein [Psychromonas antarctica]MCG6202797.1 hypothetical protein [Psychromonas antarctica]
MKYFFFIFLYSISFNALSNEYYKIINKGQSYSWITEYKDRKKYIDKHLPYISKKLRDKIISYPDSSYDARNGDVGVLVADLSPQKQRVILDVYGSLIILKKEKSVIQPASSRDNEVFKKAQIGKFNNNKYGFVLGKTELIETLMDDRLKSQKLSSQIIPDTRQKVTNVAINNYDKAPCVIDICPYKTTLTFVEHKLARITHFWKQHSGEKTRLHSVIYQANEKKYERDFTYRDNGSSLWINPYREAHLYNSLENKMEYIQYQLIDTQLMDKYYSIQYNEKKRKQELLDMKKAEEESTQIENASNSL